MLLGRGGQGMQTAASKCMGKARVIPWSVRSMPKTPLLPPGLVSGDAAVVAGGAVSPMTRPGWGSKTGMNEKVECGNRGWIDGMEGM